MTAANIAALLSYAMGDALTTELVLLLAFVLALNIRRLVWRKYD